MGNGLKGGPDGGYWRRPVRVGAGRGHVWQARREGPCGGEVEGILRKGDEREL